MNPFSSRPFKELSENLILSFKSLILIYELDFISLIICNKISFCLGDFLRRSIDLFTVSLFK